MRRLVPFALLLLAACDSSNQCKPGEKGCGCIQQSCNPGLVCSSGTCTDEQLGGLSFDQRARGCEVLLKDADGGKVSRVDFAGGVVGKWLRQGDKVAAAFIADKDQPMGAVQVAYAGSFDILRSHCYGSDGVEIPGATVSR